MEHDIENANLERIISRYENKLIEIVKNNDELSKKNLKLAKDNQYLQLLISVYEKQIERQEKIIDKLVNKSF